jgi:hypothetical protein
VRPRERGLLKEERMKYKPINGYTKQKIIDTIMVRNKGRRAFDPAINNCMYRTGDGNHCAVGCFIPEDHEAMTFEGGIRSLLTVYPSLGEVLPLGDYELVEMQYIHDRCIGEDPRPALIKWVEENVED